MRPKAQTPARPHPSRWLFIWFGLLVVAISSATAGALLAVSLSTAPLKNTKTPLKNKEIYSAEAAVSRNTLQLPSLTRPVNILVLGTKVLSSEVVDPTLPKDLGYQALVNSFDGLSDTMLLVRFDPDRQKVSVLSIPRDTKVFIEGHGESKINAANAYGGPVLAAKTISHLLGDVPIDRYVRINVQGVGKLIDALGGVEVYVPKDLKYQDDSQHLYISLKKGQQRLNGEQALQFLRFRYDEYGDISRVQRQQMFMRALMEQTLKPSTIGKLPELWGLIQSHVDTNLSTEELLALAGFAGQTPRQSVNMLLLPGDFNGDGRQGVSYWLPYEGRIQSLMAQYFGLNLGLNGAPGTLTTNGDSPGEMQSLRIAIQNSTGDPQAAAAVARRLGDLGYRSVSIRKDWPETLTQTRIIAQSGDSTSTQQVQRNLGFGAVQVDNTGQLDSDVTIQLGQDWQRRPTAQP